MKFQVGRINISVRNFLRNCGYQEISNPHKAGEISYVRNFYPGNFYPRFHIYTQILTGGDLEINLHLDMKKPSYEGSFAHSGEYDGEVVERETQRIKNFIKRISQEQIAFKQQFEVPENKSFWGKIMNFFRN